MCKQEAKSTALLQTMLMSLQKHCWSSDSCQSKLSCLFPHSFCFHNLWCPLKSSLYSRKNTHGLFWINILASNLWSLNSSLGKFLRPICTYRRVCCVPARFRHNNNFCYYYIGIICVCVWVEAKYYCKLVLPKHDNQQDNKFYDLDWVLPVRSSVLHVYFICILYQHC